MRKIERGYSPVVQGIVQAIIYIPVLQGKPLLADQAINSQLVEIPGGHGVQLQGNFSAVPAHIYLLDGNRLKIHPVRAVFLMIFIIVTDETIILRIVPYGVSQRTGEG